MQASLMVLAVLLSQADTAPPLSSDRPAVSRQDDGVTLSHCLISLSEEAKVPAKESGQIVKIYVKDGQLVTKDQMLAQIDDVHSQMEYRVAEKEYLVAKEQSENDINVRYSQAAADVARAQVLTGEEANRRMAGSVTQAQMREWQLTHKKFLLEIEQAQFKMRTDKLEADAKKTKMDASQENINRRQIKAPLDGVVVDLKLHDGEWVQPGDTLLRILRVDRLRIEGFLKAADYAPAELLNKSVTVSVDLAHGRREPFKGKVVFVSPVVEAGGEFLVRVEVLNREENGFWILRPGLISEMTIHLK